MSGVESIVNERLLTRIPDTTLFKLQLATMCIPAGQRHAVDHALLDRIGREWQRRNRA